MVKERLRNNYNESCDLEKYDFAEWLIICNYMEEEDFNKLLDLENLNRKEFLEIIDFLYQQECFITLFKIIARYINRFQNRNINFIDDIKLISDFESRLEKLSAFTNFSIPKL